VSSLEARWAGRAGLQAATARSHAGAGYRASVNAYCTGRVLDAGARATARPLVLPHCIQHCWLARGSRAGCGRRQLLVDGGRLVFFIVSRAMSYSSVTTPLCSCCPCSSSVVAARLMVDRYEFVSLKQE